MSGALPPEIVDAVSGPLMMEHMREFARWRKESGTPEELESLAYVEAKMREYGYATELILHDAYISLPGPAHVAHEGRRLKAITHSFSRASPTRGLTAPVVDVGGGSEAAFADVDARGRIVLVDGIANPAVSRRASLAGAVGQLHISPHEHLHEMCISPVWGSPTHETADKLPSTVVLTIAKDDGEALRAALTEKPDLAVTLHAEVDTRWRKTPILVADLPGPGGDGGDDPFIFFTGHHDTWYYGVMDNGGANATMMEVARIAAAHRERWRRALRVVFWSGHSQGRYSGSTWYADAHWEELERRALVHVNVDSTGGKGNTVVADTTAAAELRGLAREATSIHADQEFSGRRMGRAGDQSFWGIGVPAIFANMSEQPATGEANASAAVFGGGRRVGHGTGWWWHTPDDLLDKIEEPILVRDTKIYLHAVWRLLADPVLPLDWAEHASYLLGELEPLQERLGERFDLAVAIARARRLRTLAEDIAARAASADAAARARINAALIEVARALVPLDYTSCDRFEQDPALSQPAYPSLDPIRRLAALDDPGTEAAGFLHVGAMRARNRLAHGLRCAVEALEAVADDRGKEAAGTAPAGAAVSGSGR